MTAGLRNDGRHNLEIRSAPRRLDLNDTVVNESGRRSPVSRHCDGLEYGATVRSANEASTSPAQRVIPATAVTRAAVAAADAGDSAALQSHNKCPAASRRLVV